MKIACIGNITYDYTVTTENFIKEGLKASFINPTYTVGGPASNAAYVISKFKNKVDFYGQIGQDNFGNYIYNELYNEKVSLSHLSVYEKTSTPFSFIIVNPKNATRTICSVRNEDDLVNPSIYYFNYETNYDYILTDGKYYEESKKLIENNKKAISIIDAGRVNNSVIKLCKIVNYIICSEEFASELTGIKMETEEEYLKCYEALKKTFTNALGITITIGSRGYIAENGHNEPYNSGLPAIDTNGAGDIFHGAFTHAIANGRDYYESLEFANITASLSTTKSGGRKSCPELSEVETIEKQKKLKKNKE